LELERLMASRTGGPKVCRTLAGPFAWATLSWWGIIERIGRELALELEPRPRLRQASERVPSRLGPPPPPTSDAVTASMKGNRGKDTGPELRLRLLLREAGRPATGSQRRTARASRHCVRWKEGCYLRARLLLAPLPHLPACAFPRVTATSGRRKFDLNVERDAKKIELLEQLGWRVIVVWECRLAAEPQAVVAEIEQALVEAIPVAEVEKVLGSRVNATKVLSWWGCSHTGGG